MIEALRRWYRNRAVGPYVRPWGLATPILVLIVCLPLLRPLRSADISENEAARLATIQAIVEDHTLAIDHTSFQTLPPISSSAGRQARYSKQPPVLAVLLAGPYWVLHRLGISFATNQALAAYLLTLLGATLPVAASAGLVYRAGRVFELTRPWRMLLALAAVFGSGLAAYATVLNSHAPAAALILTACGCFFHAGTARHHAKAAGWLYLAGGATSLAAVIDLGAVIFLILLVAVVFSLRWPASAKLGGLICYALGALPPILLHAALTVPITGDLRPGFLHTSALAADVSRHPAADEDADWDDSDETPSFSATVVMHLVDGLLGPRGILSHFPILLLGIAGIGAVLHRHWPSATKTMAMVSLIGAGVIVAAYISLSPDWDQPMFSVRWFILFLPLIIFWGGAWLRRSHHPAIWTGAGALLAFSIITTLLGATAPFTRTPHHEYSAYAAARQLIKGPPLPEPYQPVGETITSIRDSVQPIERP